MPTGVRSAKSSWTSKTRPQTSSRKDLTPRVTTTSSREDQRYSKASSRRRKRSSSRISRQTRIWSSTSWAGLSLTLQLYRYHMRQLLELCFGSASNIRSKKAKFTYSWRSSNRIRKTHPRCSQLMRSWSSLCRREAIDSVNLGTQIIHSSQGAASSILTKTLRCETFLWSQKTSTRSCNELS